MRDSNNQRVMVLLTAASLLGWMSTQAFAQTPPAAPAAEPPPAPVEPPATPPAEPVTAPTLAQALPAEAPGVAAQASPRPLDVEATPATPTLVEAIIGGKVAAALRYRYEYLGREDIDLAARVSTLRVALGYETKPFYGFSVLGQFEGATSIGRQEWRVPTADMAYKPNQQHQNLMRPLVADTVGSELNQAVVKYATSWLTMKLGRQELTLNNGRIISVVPWRQRNQTMDAANVDVSPFKGANANYVFIRQANRVVGGDALDGQLKMNTHVGNLTYKKPGLVNVAVYDVYLDYRDLPQVVTAAGAPMVDMLGAPVRIADGSTNTVGGRVEGPFELNDAWGLIYALELTHQSDVGGNPLAVDAYNYGAELGVGYRGLGLRAQYNVRGGTRTPMTGEAFQTPLAHSWDGWAENFNRTPKSGLRLLAAHLAGPVPVVKGLALTLAYFEYFAHTDLPDGSIAAGDHYGRELDAGLEYRFVGLDKNWLIGGRLAVYAADQLAPSMIPNGAGNLRTSLYTSYAF
jgi:hypothetical protein